MFLASSCGERSGDAVAACAPLPPLGGRFIPLRGGARWGPGRRGPAHGDGRRWRARPPITARIWVAHPRRGRGELRGFRNATSSDQAGGRGGGGNAYTHAASYSPGSRTRSPAMIQSLVGAEKSDWTCEGHFLTVALQFRFKSR